MFHFGFCVFWSDVLQSDLLCVLVLLVKVVSIDVDVRYREEFMCRYEGSSKRTRDRGQKKKIWRRTDKTIRILQTKKGEKKRRKQRKKERNRARERERERYYRKQSTKKNDKKKEEEDIKQKQKKIRSHPFIRPSQVGMIDIDYSSQEDGGGSRV